MNAPIKSAALCLVLFFASSLAARGNLTGTPKWDHKGGVGSAWSAIAPDYVVNAGQSDPDPSEATPAPEAATMLLCGAGILVIFAGMGVRRATERKAGK